MPDEKKTVGFYAPNAVLQDYKGELRTLRELSGGKVLVLNPIYTRCTSACPVMTQSLKKTVKELKEDVTLVSLTFDPRDTLDDLKRFKEVQSLPENWYVVKEKEYGELLKAVDYRFSYDEKLGEFEHPNLYVVLSPSLKISRYLYGVSPRSRDLRLAVLEAKREEARLSPVEGFWLRCFRYDGEEGTYKLDWSFLLNVMGGLLTFLLVPLVVWGGGLRGFLRSINNFLIKNS